MLTIREFTDRYITIALELHGDNRTRAAKALGISIRTLRNRLAAMRENREHITKLSTEENHEILHRLFPTNEERILYKDTFPNRCGPR